MIESHSGESPVMNDYGCQDPNNSVFPGFNIGSYRFKVR